MPRVHYVKKARTRNPVAEAGESYYWWKFAFSPKSYSKTPPKPSQLTQSEFLSQLYDLQDRMGNLLADDSLPNGVESIIEDIRALGEECREKKENMPEALQDGDTGQLLEERADGMESWADEIEGLDCTEEPMEFSVWEDEWRGNNPVSDTETDEEYKARMDEAYPDYCDEHWQGKLDEVQGTDSGL